MKLLASFTLLLFSACSQLKGILPEHDPKKDKSPIVIWNKNFDPSYDSGNLPIYLGGTTIYKGLVYSGSPRGTMRAMEASNGRVVWKKEDGDGMHASPIVEDDIIYYGTRKGRFFARDAYTGERKFAVDLGSSIEADPFLYKGRILLHLRNHKILSLDQKTGKILWAYQRSVPFKTTVQRASMPVIYEGKIFVGFADGFVVSLSLDEGIVLWEKKLSTGTKFIDVDLTPRFYKGHLYIASLTGDLQVLNPKTGALRRVLDYSVSRGPYFFENEKIAIGTLGGELVLLDGDFKEYKKIQFGSNEAVTSVTSWGRYFVIGTTAGKIHFVNASSLEIEETFHLGAEGSSIFTEMKKEKDTLVAYSSRNRLYVFKGYLGNFSK